MMRKLHSTAKIPLVLTISLMSGCSIFTPKVPEDVKTNYPSSMPKPVVTNFNEALACMDNLMLVQGVAPIYVSSEGLQNYTADSSISAGGKEMLITALSKMAIRSNGVRFVSYGSDIANMLSLQGAHPDHGKFRVPDFFIRGGVTQDNKNLWNGQTGSGASVELEQPQIVDTGTYFTLLGQKDVTQSFSLSANYGTVTLDMSAGYVATLQIVPGSASANTLALENQRGSGVTADLSVGDLGYSYSFTSNRSLDFNTVFRSLVEVGAIEIVGKLQNVPYWRCLANAGSVETRDQELLKEYAKLFQEDQSQIVKFYQATLKALKFYSGKVSGTMDEPTRVALQGYQQQMGLLASGLMNYETYRMMKLFTPTTSPDTTYWWQNYLGMSNPPAASVAQAQVAQQASGNPTSKRQTAKK